MKLRRYVAVLVVLLIALPLAVAADPVTMSDSAAVERGVWACSVWVEPSGDDYAWTTICGYSVDFEDDGVVDERWGLVDWAYCNSDDPKGGALCHTDERIEGLVAETDFTFDFDAGLAGLHADIPGCRLDVDWTATAEAQSGSLGEDPEVWPYIAPPMLSVAIHSREVAYSTRDAAHSGPVCVAAMVSGPPKASYLLEYTDTARTQRLTIDPTA